MAFDPTTATPVKSSFDPTTATPVGVDWESITPTEALQTAFNPVALGETALNMGTGMLAKPISDIAGIGAIGYEAATGNKDPGRPAALKQRIQEGSTYAPRTRQGQIAAEYNPIAMAGKGWSGIGKLAGDAIQDQAPDNPWVTGAANAVTEAIPQGVAFLGAKATGNIPKVQRSLNIQRGQNAARDVVATKALKQGYRLTPTMVNPSRVSRATEYAAGPVHLEEGILENNVTRVDNAGRKTLGLSIDTPLAPETFSAVRRSVEPAYDAVRSVGAISLDSTFFSDLSRIESKYTQPQASFPRLKNDAQAVLDSVRLGKGKNAQPLSVMDASHAIDMTKLLREKANAEYMNGNPKNLGKVYKKVADTLEAQIDRHLQNTLNADTPPSMQWAQFFDNTVKNFRAAREKIAQSYAVQGSMDSGHLNALKLKSKMDKGQYLDQPLKDAAEFATHFPRAVRIPNKPASPFMRPSDWGLDLTSGLAATATGQPWLIAPAVARHGLQAFLPSAAGQGLFHPPSYRAGLAGPLSTFLSGEQGVDDLTPRNYAEGGAVEKKSPVNSWPTGLNVTSPLQPILDAVQGSYRDFMSKFPVAPDRLPSPLDETPEGPHPYLTSATRTLASLPGLPASFANWTMNLPKDILNTGGGLTQLLYNATRLPDSMGGQAYDAPSASSLLKSKIPMQSPKIPWDMEHFANELGPEKQHTQSPLGQFAQDTMEMSPWFVSPTNVARSAAGEVAKGFAGSGLLSYLTHFAPNVIKKEGGQYFPGTIDKAVKDLFDGTARTGNPPLRNWTKSVFKNYMQNRMGAPSDEIRQLIDQGIGANANGLQWNNTASATGAELHGRTPEGREWENRVDNLFKSDAAITQWLIDSSRRWGAAAQRASMPGRIKDMPDTARVGALTKRVLDRAKFDYATLPEELQTLKTKPHYKLTDDEAQAFTDHFAANPDILEQIKTGYTPPKTKDWTEWRVKYYEAYNKLTPEQRYTVKTMEGLLPSTPNAHLEGLPPYISRNAGELQGFYKHLPTRVPGETYENAKFRTGGQSGLNPFFDVPPTIAGTRARLTDHAPWVNKVPEDTPIWQLNMQRDSDPTRPLPGTSHLMDVMSAKLADGSLNPESLKQGRVSVADAWRMMHEYDTVGEKLRLKEAGKALSEKIEPYVSDAHADGWKWIAMPDLHTDPTAHKLVQDLGVKGGWCTRSESVAKSYGGGKKQQLHILIDPQGHPHAQAQVKVEGSSAHYGVSIPQFKPVGNGWSSQQAQDWEAKIPGYKNLVQSKMQSFIQDMDSGVDPNGLNRLKSGHPGDIQQFPDSGNAGMNSRHLFLLYNVRLDPDKSDAFHTYLDNNWSNSEWVPDKHIADAIYHTDNPRTFR